VSRSSEPRGTAGEAGTPEAYDQMVARLEKVVGELEGGGLTLEQSLEKFAERRIEMLVRAADGGDEAVPLEGGKDP
jgi:exodeoxyribonuclease VII small subunit